ncbi:MAG: 1,4-dihydroxy-6-naphthoate synthase [Desulfovibrio sp.]|nr:1,4-dihydroxy-6-naphthoate synthase [Desulfovibrio sp.]
MWDNTPLKDGERLLPASCSLGISPCPNDTYIFEALIHGRIAAPFSPRLHIADVEELNAKALRGELDVSKLSLAVVPAILERYILLNSGGALGRGCGPLLVARPDLEEKERTEGRIAIPGRMTTANLLLSLHGGFRGPRLEMLFDRVMPALCAKEAELGLIIHEGRFTYAERGLSLVLDLGQWWEVEKNLPLPLGVIAVKRALGRDFALAADAAVRASLAYARTRPDEGKKFIAAHAKEMDEDVMRRHIELFVNRYSMDLGREGREAVLELLRAGASESGVSLPDLPVFVE